eukprot:Platyproteum_vivax@DN1845_c0_g1_i1.p1
MSNVHGSATLVATVFNCVNSLLGLGFVTLPSAFERSGWVPASLAIMATGLVTLYTAVAIERLCKETRSHSLGEMAGHVFGPTSRALIGLIVIVELLLCISSNMLVAAENLSKVLPALSVTASMIICFLVVLPTVWTRALSKLAIISAFGSVCALVLTLSVVGDCSIRGNRLTTTKLYRWQGVWESVGMMVSCFAIHAIFPNLRESMINPGHFKSMIWISYVVSLSIFCILGVFGYAAYGDQTNPNVTLNLPAPNDHWWAAVVTGLLVVNPLTRVGLLSAPLCSALGNLIPYPLPRRPLGDGSTYSVVPPITVHDELGNPIAASRASSMLASSVGRSRRSSWESASGVAAVATRSLHKSSEPAADLDDPFLPFHHHLPIDQSHNRRLVAEVEGSSPVQLHSVYPATIEMEEEEKEPVWLPILSPKTGPIIPFLETIVGRSLVLACALIVGVLVPFFGLLVSLIGSSLSLPVSVVIPALALWWSMSRSTETQSKMSLIESVFALSIVFIGMVLTVIGTATAMVDIYEQLNRSNLQLV